jgi:hypothetical protein
MARSSKLPRFPSGKLVLVPGDVWNKVMDRIEQITPLSGRNVLIDENNNGSIISAVFPGYVAQPFELTLLSTGSAYKVTVGPGLVNERIPGSDPGLATHYPSNIGGFTEDRVEFSISVGQQISLRVLVKANGQVGHDSDPPVTVVIEDEDRESVHYIPPGADDSTGTNGAYHYKLGVLRAGDVSTDPPHLERWLSGDHIEHFQDVTRLDNVTNPSTTNLARPLKKYDADTNRWLFRSLVPHPDGQAKVDETADEMRVRGNEKAFVLNFVDCAGSPLGTINWADGMITSEGSLTIHAGCQSSETPP